MNKAKEKYLNTEFITNEGKKVVIIEYISSLNASIQYEDGLIIRNINVAKLKKGEVRYPISNIGKYYYTNQGYKVKIIEYVNFYNTTIKFNDKSSTILKNVNLGSLRKGAVVNPYHPSVFGVGYCGEGTYISNISSKVTKSWKAMLGRCYYYKENPTYKDVTVCEEWHNFQNFAEWFEQNYNSETMQGWHLDKDILVKGNKIYSPVTCCFVPQEINNQFTIDKERVLPKGVSLDRKSIRATISKFGKYQLIGYFSTINEASEAYKKERLSYIKELSEKWKSQITENVYNILINYEL